MTYDVFFVSFDEPNADANFERVRSIVPGARRVHGVKGIHEAHKACAEQCTSDHFFVVDGDNWIVDGFDFTVPFPVDPNSVYVWRCRNAVNKLVYGYGAIKLLPTAHVLGMGTQTVDMTTSVSVNYVIVDTLASETRFNTSAFEAWKSGFREAVKLASRVIDRQKDRETQERLDVWVTRGADEPFGTETMEGARMGRDYGLAHRDDPAALRKINHWGWLRRTFLCRDGQQEPDALALVKPPDVFLIDNGEANAGENFERLLAVAPDAQRIAGVRDYLERFRRCAKIATTDHLFVVEGTNWVVDDFDFDVPFTPDPDKVYVWRCRNAVNGLVYGLGAARLIPKRHALDGTFESLPHVPVATIATEMRFNTSAFEAWRVAFREAAKLASKISLSSTTVEKDLLEVWMTKGAEQPFGPETILGAKMGRHYGLAHGSDAAAMQRLNDRTWLRSRFQNRGVWDVEGQPRHDPLGARREGFADNITTLLHQTFSAVRRFPEANWQDALAMGQLQSKMWLIDELAKLDGIQLGTVFVLGGWLGTLPALMFADGRLRVAKIRSFDIDPSCAQVADAVNARFVMEDWRFKAATCDMCEIDYANPFSFSALGPDGLMKTGTDRANTLINTSCDHIAPFADWYDRIPLETLVVVQNNDFADADDTHTNTVASLEEFRAQTPMTQVLFEGQLVLPAYTRFMRIGIR